MSPPAPLSLREFHESLGAVFAEVNGAEVVANYGDALREYRAISETAGVLDLSFRSRLCLTGADRVRFLHGQITNDVKKLRVGEGCYSALTNAKGKMQSDLSVVCLQDELLLDFEPGLTSAVSGRLQKYIVADDVEIVDVSPHYGLLSVQGPRAGAVIRAIGIFPELPNQPLASSKITDATLGEVYLMAHARLALGAKADSGYDLFVPLNALKAIADKLIAASRSVGGGPCGWTAFEYARVEAGVPRYGADMDETNLPTECGIEARAISYQKGCYIGQEVLNRIHSIGHVNRELRGLWLSAELVRLPDKGTKIFRGPQEVGVITSAVFSPRFQTGLALAYVRREANQLGAELTLRLPTGDFPVHVAALPFEKAL